MYHDSYVEAVDKNGEARNSNHSHNTDCGEKVVKNSHVSDFSNNEIVSCNYEHSDRSVHISQKSELMVGLEHNYNRDNLPTNLGSDCYVVKALSGKTEVTLM